MQGDCQWPLKNGGEFPPVTWAHNPLQLRQSQPIFRPTNHKSVMPAIWRPCLISRWQSYWHQAGTVYQSMVLLLLGNKCCVAKPWCHDREMLSYEICTFAYLFNMACMDYMDPNVLCPQKAVKLDYSLDQSMFCIMGQNCRKAVMEWNRACHPGVPHYWPFVKGITRPFAGAWCHHQMETFSASLALCEGNPLVTGGFPS